MLEVNPLRYALCFERGGRRLKPIRKGRGLSSNRALS